MLFEKIKENESKLPDFFEPEKSKLTDTVTNKTFYMVTSSVFIDSIREGYLPKSELIEFSEKMKKANDKIKILLKEALDIKVNRNPIVKGIYVTTMPFPSEKLDLSLIEPKNKKLIKFKKSLRFNKIEYWSKPVILKEFRRAGVSSKILKVFKDSANIKSRFLSNPKYFEKFLD